jgi:CRISPR-associated endoribonuclease Cas6
LGRYAFFSGVGAKTSLGYGLARAFTQVGPQDAET